VTLTDFHLTDTDQFLPAL